MSKPLQLTQHQRAAADPGQSVWVTANAGTGKTKVLTDRVLRLLLTGTHPEKILCLTYTRAAAAEMLVRLQQELARWVRLDEAELDLTLETLTGHKADDHLRRRARKLFLDVLEAPEGVRMMTIHSLCQSLLKRFSLEAGVSPYFRLMEESQTSLLLAEARRLLFTEPRLAKEIADLTPSLQKLASRLSEDGLDELLDEIIRKRGVFEQWFRPKDGPEEVRKKVSDSLNIAENNDYYRHLSSRLDDLAAAATILQTGSNTDKKMAEKYAQWINHWQNHPQTPPDETLLDGWRSCFLTSKHTPLAKPIQGKLAKEHPAIAQIIFDEQQRVYDFYQQRFAQEAAEWSLAILSLAEALLELYRKLKQDRGLLDYDDLIADTHQLLSREGIAPWILFKLDNGIDHLLVDEAQDTSPIQWKIVQLLAEEFFHGESARQNARTLFVVGDEKQSIYRFQGADPDAFAQMKHYFAQKIQQSGENWQPVSLSLSFRSTPAVLKLVDYVFAQNSARDGVIEEGLDAQHQPNRQVPGRVECWPLTSQQKTEDARTPWQVPDSRNARENPTAEAQCARQIANTIASWLKEKRSLPARGRPIEAGDILILVRRRSPFYYRLIRALKSANVPVAGEDRLHLLDQLAVQDMLALADFLLLPQDDLSLACLLKSPLFGMSEEELFTLAHGRKGNLWDQLKAQHPQIAHPLNQWLNAVDYLRPYELFAHILEAQGGREKLAARLGTQVHDPLNELLTLARDYERMHPPSLQGFIQELRREDIVIKREMEQAGSNVRVMTVHGSKGLQAPIVILPDTVNKPQDRSKLIWADDHVFFAPDDAGKCEQVLTLKQQRKAEEMREYRRLLYVALTRAADELYICGWLDSNRSSAPDDCWYSHIETAMQQFGQEQADGKWVLADPVIVNAQNEHSNTSTISTSQPVTAHNLPNWLSQTAPQEPTPPRPLMPSKPKLAEPASDSPLQASHSPTIQRGTLLHRLLEILPDVPAAQRRQSAAILLQKHAIPEEEAKQWTNEILTILEDPNFAAVFGENSLAEVPVTAVLKDGQVLSGQIDRLIVQEDSVLIVDYKTSRNVPASEAQIPNYFRAQMQAYMDAISPIYPNKKIKAAILWTHLPKLMPLAIEPTPT